MYGRNIRPLAFGIDFDDTISLAPELFKNIINLLKKYGHYVVIVTSRKEGDYDDLLKEFENYVDAIQFTSARAKQDEVDGIDIWIDDFPLCITHHFDGGAFKAGKKAQKWISH